MSRSERRCRARRDGEADGDRRITARASNFGCAEAGLTRVSAYAVPGTAADIDCSGAGSVRSQHIAFTITLAPPAATGAN